MWTSPLRAYFVSGAVTLRASLRGGQPRIRRPRRCVASLRALRLESDVMPTSLSQQEIEHILQLYQLFKQGDPAFLDLYEPDATLVFPDSLPNGGTYHSPLEALEFWN